MQVRLCGGASPDLCLAQLEISTKFAKGYSRACTPSLAGAADLTIIADDSLGEAFSTISFDRSNVFTGRVGALLRGTFGSTGAVWQPYLKATCGGAPMASTP